MNTPQPPENIESVIEGIEKSIEICIKELIDREGFGSLVTSRADIVEVFTKALLTSYEAGVAEGRSSMKRDIEAVVPGFRLLRDPADCPRWNSGFNACRSQLIANIKDIV